MSDKNCPACKRPNPTPHSEHTEPEPGALEINRITIRKIVDSNGRVGILVDYGDNIALSDAIQMLAWANQFVVRDFFADESDDK